MCAITATPSLDWLTRLNTSPANQKPPQSQAGIRNVPRRIHPIMYAMRMRRLRQR